MNREEAKEILLEQIKAVDINCVDVAIAWLSGSFYVEGYKTKDGKFIRIAPLSPIPLPRCLLYIVDAD